MAIFEGIDSLLARIRGDDLVSVLLELGFLRHSQKEFIFHKEYCLLALLIHGVLSPVSSGNWHIRPSGCCSPPGGFSSFFPNLSG
ncbi:MAG: hypothetical protein ACOYM2_09825 [Rectinemataceae bacterium]